MKAISGLAAMLFLSLGGVCFAQLPPGVTAEMIASSLPEEGAPKAVAGRYKVAIEPAYGSPGLKTFRPTALLNFPTRDTLPVVVWGNGGCAIDNPKYDGLLSTIASQGFLVVTTAGAPADGAPPARATADNLTAAVDWAERENTRSGSPLAGKIATTKVAVMGQSCGGVLAITLGADPRVGTIGVFNSGVQASDAQALARLHGPVLLINGHERDFMMARSKETYDAIDKLPAFYGSRHGAGHTATAYHLGGGEFANVAANWVRWQFKGDRRAAEMFVGANCTLCTNKNWDAESKRLVVDNALVITGMRRRTTKDGQELFCKREVMTGSRTNVTETCLTQAQAEAQSQNSQDALRRIQSQPGAQPAMSGNGVTNGAMSPH